MIQTFFFVFCESNKLSFQYFHFSTPNILKAIKSEDTTYFEEEWSEFSIYQKDHQIPSNNFL